MAQVATYLRLLTARQGLLINFNVPLLRDGIKSILAPRAVSQREEMKK
jgi:hypothetical protein